MSNQTVLAFTCFFFAGIFLASHNFLTSFVLTCSGVMLLDD